MQKSQSAQQVVIALSYPLAQITHTKRRKKEEKVTLLEQIKIF